MTKKPDALMIDGKPFFSLTSYEPVECEVVVAHVTDEDVEISLANMAAAAGGTMADMENDLWVAKHFEGATNADFIRSEIRENIEQINRRVARDQAAEKCTAALASRLRQAVPAERVAELRVSAETAFREQLAQEGMTLELLLLQTGFSQADIDATFDEQAVRMAEEDAALDAFASERKLTVTDEEIVRYLGLDMAHAQDPSQPEGMAILAQARAVGRFDQLRQPALQAKALETVMSEAHCTFRDETDEEAAARIANFKRAVEARMEFEASQAAGNSDANADTNAGEKNDGPRLKLV